MKNRDIIVLKKIMDYSRQLEEACAMFDNDYNKFVESSVFQSGLQFSMICRS